MDSKNQLTSVGGSSCTYDSNGNLTFSGPGAVTYSYDDENQLISAQTATNWRTEWVYDGRGRLRIRREYTWMSGWFLTSETRYVYDGMRMIQERNSGNTPTVSYTRGTDLSGGLEGAGGIGGLLARSHGYSSGSWTGHNFYHTDGGGNVTVLIDNAGTPNVTATYRYDPFGNTITTTGTNAANNVYRFSSKERHANSGMYYYGYRFYDPNLQRWLNRDPIGEPGFEVSLHHKNAPALANKRLVRLGFSNRYGFVRNQPLTHYDPHGLAERGPNTTACKQAEEQAEAAWDLYEAEPSDENLENAILLSVWAAYMCTAPKPPPPPPPPPCPWWQRFPPIWRWPFIILDPCIFDPTLCGGTPTA